MGLIVNLIGQKFHRLTVISKSSLKKRDKPLWECLCECGNKTLVKTSDLRRGKTKSCGCLRFECKSNFSHGQGSPKNKTREYRIWQGMIQRVNNPNAPAYHRYGGRGISICENWRSFINFFNDMGAAPTNKHSIDRINGDGDYEKSNCRWASAIEQNRNKQSNHWIEHLGKRLILKEWATLLGTSSTNIIFQLRRKPFERVYDYYSNKHNLNRP